MGRVKVKRECPVRTKSKYENNYRFSKQKNTFVRNHNDRNTCKQNEKWNESSTFQESQGNSIVYSEECDPYFKNVLETLKQGIDNDQKGIFIQNVLDQTKEQELKLSCQNIGSHCIELLLEESDDLSAIVRFMNALAANKEDACGNRFASHVTENLLYHGLRHLQNWSADIDPVDDSENAHEKAKQLIEVMSWIHSFGEFCLENLPTCLDDEYACHVLRTLIQVLGGNYVGDSSLNHGKRAKEQRRHFEREYLGFSFMSKQKQPITLKEIPKFFVKVLKKLSKAFLQLENIKRYAIEPRTSPILQSFLFVLKKRLPKHSKKFVKAITFVLFEEKNNEGIPVALIHKNCSYVVEKLFEAALESQQDDLWKEHICNHLEQMIVHPVGNFVLQRLIDVVESKNLFESMCKSIFELFQTVFNARNFGILVSMASACVRLEWQQAQFMENLMQCLHCLEPEDKQIYFIPLLLGFQTYDQCMQSVSCPEYSMLITLQGSLIAQSLLKFHKPIKVVKSILSMKPESLKYLTCHVQGCHVLTGFLSSANIGEKNKDKFLNLLKPALAAIATDRNGSLTLSRMWVLLSLKQKGVIAQEMAKIEKSVSINQCGTLVLKKFGIFHFKNKHEQWKQFQQNLTRKRQLTD